MHLNVTLGSFLPVPSYSTTVPPRHIQKRARTPLALLPQRILHHNITMKHMRRAHISSTKNMSFYYKIYEDWGFGGVGGGSCGGGVGGFCLWGF